MLRLNCFPSMHTPVDRLFNFQLNDKKDIKKSKNKILRYVHVLCHLVTKEFNKNEFRSFFAKLRHVSVKQLLWLYMKSEKMYNISK
jgi:hypothetical protein